MKKAWTNGSLLKNNKRGMKNVLEYNNDNDQEWKKQLERFRRSKMFSYVKFWSSYSDHYERKMEVKINKLW
jgi:hypothetical protein